MLIDISVRHFVSTLCSAVGNVRVDHKMLASSRGGSSDKSADRSDRRHLGSFSMRLCPPHCLQLYPELRSISEIHTSAQLLAVNWLAQLYGTRAAWSLKRHFLFDLTDVATDKHKHSFILSEIAGTGPEAEKSCVIGRCHSVILAHVDSLKASTK